MKRDSVRYNIVKEKEGKTKKVGFYQFDKEFIEDFFLNDNEILEASIYTHRIIANIALTLNADQFFIKDQNNHQLKLELFDNEFMGEDNSGMLFKMNSVEICKGGNYKSLKDALDFLEQYKRGWYDTINEKGEKISFLGGLISNATINRKTGNFQFFITSYWLKKLLNLGYYNRTYYRLVLETSSNKHMIFWYWLSILPEEGTMINFETINKNYNLNYKTARDVCKSFLRPIKQNFDERAHISFNYSYSGNIIRIAKYRLNPDSLIQNHPIKEKSYQELKNRYKISYLTKRHDLGERQIGSLKQLMELQPVLFVDSYQSFISECRAKKVAASKYKGKDFVEAFQNSIIKIYKETSSGKIYPNAFPKIIS